MCCKCHTTYNYYNTQSWYVFVKDNNHHELKNRINNFCIDLVYIILEHLIYQHFLFFILKRVLFLIILKLWLWCIFKFWGKNRQLLKNGFIWRWKLKWRDTKWLQTKLNNWKRHAWRTNHRSVRLRIQPIRITFSMSRTSRGHFSECQISID